MSRSLTTPESPELIHLHQQTLLKEFLVNVKKMIKDQAALHLPKTLDETQHSIIIKPQVFISYAWEANASPKLTHLHAFLKQLADHLAAAGLTPWLDIQRMTGDLDEQMRTGIQDSQYVLLIGTNRYAERTKPDSNTNVRKELDFTLVEAKKSSDFLLPLMLEGDYGTTFPTVGKYLIRDCRSWYSLESGEWQSFENYIKELTQPEPLGILPCLLGLNRRERQWIKYRQACLKQYQEKQQALMNALELLQKRQAERDTKSSPSGPENLQKMQPEKEEKWNKRWQSNELSATTQKEEKQRQSEMERLKLAQEQQPAQLPTAIKTLETEKQEEFGSLQLELKRLKERTETSKEQLKLQDELVIACEQGDLKTVRILFKTTLFRKITAKPHLANTTGKQPLGAAIWGMNPEVVNELLKQNNDIAPMTWEECKKHNLIYYKLEYYAEAFMVPKSMSNLQTFEEWYQLLEIIKTSLFLKGYHLEKVNEQWGNKASSSWKNLEKYVKTMADTWKDAWKRGDLNFDDTRVLIYSRTFLFIEGLENFRTQIKQRIESAKQPIELIQEQQQSVRLTITAEEAKRQLEAELKHVEEDLKRQTPLLIQPPKLSPPLPPVLQMISQTILPPPKPKASQELLIQADQLVVGISHEGTKKRYLAKLDYYRINIDILSKADRKQLKELIEDLRRLHNNPPSTTTLSTYLTPPDQKHQSKFPLGLKQQLWSAPKPKPPTISSSASSSSSSSSSTLHSGTSSSRSTTTSSTVTLSVENPKRIK